MAATKDVLLHLASTHRDQMDKLSVLQRIALTRLIIEQSDDRRSVCRVLPDRPLDLDGAPIP